MPTYEYRCKDCGEHLEVVESFKDDALTTCPNCGGDLRKVFGAIGIAFKGSGFYKTDSRAAAANGSASKGSASKGSASKSGDSKPSGESSSSGGSSSGESSSSGGSSSSEKPSSSDSSSSSAAKAS